MAGEMPAYDCEKHGHLTVAGEETCRACGEPAQLMCQVCGKNAALGVASSGLGAVSVAYCRECLDHCAQPDWLVEFTLAQCGSWSDVREDIKEVLSVYRDGDYKLAVDVYTDEQVKELTEEFDRDVAEYAQGAENADDDEDFTL